jgi:hypothetical protein
VAVVRNRNPHDAQGSRGELITALPTALRRERHRHCLIRKVLWVEGPIKLLHRPTYIASDEAELLHVESVGLGRLQPSMCSTSSWAIPAKVSCSASPLCVTQKCAHDCSLRAFSSQARHAGGLLVTSDNATGKLSLFVQVIARADAVVAVRHPQRHTFDEQDG